MSLTHAVVIVFMVTLIFQLAGCAPPPGEVTSQGQGRYLTGGTTPLCLALCTVVVTNTEAAQFPALRQTNGDFAGNSKSTSTSQTVPATP